MYKILLNTPFGFVIELINENIYQLDEPYEVFIDGRLHSCKRQNVVSIFGLMPNTSYTVELKSSSLDICFTHKTENPSYIIDVCEYGAAGDGYHNDTMAINTAIYTAQAGSVIRFARGVYIVSSVLLKSSVDIYLEDGAEIRQTTDREQLAIVKGYQKNYDRTEAIPNATWEGNPLDCYSSVVYGCNVSDVRIYGTGIINGNGDAGDFWYDPKVKKAAWRPRNLFLAHCSGITVAGITSKNSAAWNLHPYYSENLRFYCLNIESNPNSPNTDGLNPDSCSDVTIAGCRFHVGDDCIAIKSGKFYMSRHHYKPSENIKIRNCLMEQGHGGVVIGSEISCGAKNIEVRQCLFKGTDRGLRVKTRRGRGDTSVVEGISFANVHMKNVENCFTVNMFYNCDPDGHSEYVRSKQALPVSDETPVVKDIHISNVVANGISGAAIFLSGLPESPIKGITVENSAFSFLHERKIASPEMMDDEVLIKDLGVYMHNTENITLQGNSFTGKHTIVIDDKEEYHV